MSRIHVAALLALSALALPASTVFAQVFDSAGLQGGSDLSNQGGVTDDKDTPICQGAAGGSRMRQNCEVETETLRAQQEAKPLVIQIPALESRECSATTTTEYYQVSGVARVSSALQIADCTSASGEFTVALRIRGESGEDTPLEFGETWQRSDDNDVTFKADYPIGENVELRSVRIRGLSCTCADPPSASTASESSGQSGAPGGSSQ